MLKINAADVVTEARSWIGTRWIHQGRSREGTDCFGLIVVTCREIGLPVEDVEGYRRTPNPEMFISHAHKIFDPADAPAPGMVAIFKQARYPCHLGWFAERDGKLTVIHSFAGFRQVVEEPFDYHWPALLVETRKIKGVTY